MAKKHITVILRLAGDLPEAVKDVLRQHRAAKEAGADMSDIMDELRDWRIQPEAEAESE